MSVNCFSGVSYYNAKGTLLDSNTVLAVDKKNQQVKLKV